MQPTKPIKYKNNHITRTYIYLEILEYSIIYENHKIDKFHFSEKVNELFLEIFDVDESDIQMDRCRDIINTYKQQEKFINKVREMFQHRHTAMMDKEMILLINLALAEHLTYQLDKKLVIKVYVDLTATFQESTDFIHGVLDKCLTYMIEEKDKILDTFLTYVIDKKSHKD